MMKHLLSLMAMAAVLSPIAASAQEDVPGITSEERRQASELQHAIQEKVGHDDQELLILDAFIHKLDTISSSVDRDLSREHYIEHLQTQTDPIFAKSTQQADWKALRDGFLNQHFSSSQTTLPSASERASARRIAMQAAQLEIFRLRGKDGKTFDDNGQLIIRIVGAIFRQDKIPSGPNRELQDGPFIDPGKATTLRELVRVFGETESNFDQSMSLKMYKQLATTKSDRVFARLRPVYEKAWQNGRSLLFTKLDSIVSKGAVDAAKEHGHDTSDVEAKDAPAAPAEDPMAAFRTRNGGQFKSVSFLQNGGAASNPDMLQFRALIRGPVLRALQLELARVQGLQAVRGPLNSGGGSVLAGSTGGRTSVSSRSGKRRSKLGCLDCLKFLLPFPPKN